MSLLRRRVERRRETVQGTVLWGCGSWVYTQALAQKVQAATCNMVSRITRCVKGRDEGAVHFWVRRKRWARAMLWKQTYWPNGQKRKLIGDSLYEALRLHHRWLGHVARDKGVLGRVARWRDAEWYQFMESVDRYNREGWRRARTGPPGVQWETVVLQWGADRPHFQVQYAGTRRSGPRLGVAWRAQALDRVPWLSDEWSFAFETWRRLLPSVGSRQLQLCDEVGDVL